MKINISLWSKYLLGTGIIILCLVSVLPVLAAAWQVNAWSLGFTNGIMAEGSGIPAYALDPPEAHQRAPVWLARDAIKAGEPALALDLLKPLLASGKAMVLSAQGEALAAAGVFESAVGFWIQAGDYQSLVKAAEQSVEDGQFEDAEMAF